MSGWIFVARKRLMRIDVGLLLQATASEAAILELIFNSVEIVVPSCVVLRGIYMLVIFGEKQRLRLGNATQKIGRSPYFSIQFLGIAG
jgi:hypothetical protein